MITLGIILMMLGPPIYLACAGATQQIRENKRFMRELEEIKRRAARGHAPGHDQ
jgi:hypothetical protein